MQSALVNRRLLKIPKNYGGFKPERIVFAEHRCCRVRQVALWPQLEILS